MTTRLAQTMAPALLALAFAAAFAPDAALGETAAPAETSVPAQRPAAPAQPPAADVALEAERSSIAAWRLERLDSLTSDSGWLTLAGLFWLKDGENTFGRAASNSLALDNPSLTDTAGTFIVTGQQVRFEARPESGVTYEGRSVRSLQMASDVTGKPTVLASGTLRFLVIERAGNLGVRVRDLNNPHRLQFRGLSYFPVRTDWVLDARFESYAPSRRIRIVNILGMEEDMVSPGAVVFTHKGRTFRLDTLLEEPGDQELFIMFTDGTSGHETYGGGRFMYVPMPVGDRVRVDFNKAYNPPCALNDFATCPLPPSQNRLKLRVDAGEKTYVGGPVHGGPLHGS